MLDTEKECTGLMGTGNCEKYMDMLPACLLILAVTHATSYVPLFVYEIINFYTASNMERLLIWLGNFTNKTSHGSNMFCDVTVEVTINSLRKLL